MMWTVMPLLALGLWLPPCVLLLVAAGREAAGISDRTNGRLALWAAGWFGVLLLFAIVVNVIRNFGGN